MALFRRGPAAPDSAPDEAFPFWDGGTADRFRATVRAAFAERGLEVTVYPDHVVDADGREFGLGNLAANCHNDSRAWDRVIAEHLSGILAAMDAPSAIESMSRDEILAGTYLRIMPSQDLLPTLSYAREVAPGLAQVLNLDLPTTVSYLTDDQVATVGAEALTVAGRQNLLGVAIDARESLEHGDGHIDVLLGESMFVASLVLVLDDVLARLGYAVDPDVGVLVALPFRHQLALHVPHDGTVLASLNLLAGFAAAGYGDSAGPVSPDVYWWRPGSLEQVSRTTDDGAVIEVGPDLGAMLRRFTGE